MKWRPAGFDQITYDVMIPFIRQVAGPMDYTQEPCVMLPVRIIIQVTVNR